jgi:hypothetical protein
VLITQRSQVQILPPLLLLFCAGQSPLPVWEEGFLLWSANEFANGLSVKRLLARRRPVVEQAAAADLRRSSHSRRGIEPGRGLAVAPCLQVPLVRAATAEFKVVFGGGLWAHERLSPETAKSSDYLERQIRGERLDNCGQSAVTPHVANVLPLHRAEDLLVPGRHEKKETYDLVGRRLKYFKCRW